MINYILDNNNEYVKMFDKYLLYFTGLLYIVDVVIRFYVVSKINIL